MPVAYGFAVLPPNAAGLRYGTAKTTLHRLTDRFRPIPLTAGSGLSCSGAYLRYLSSLHLSVKCSTKAQSDKVPKKVSGSFRMNCATKQRR